MFRYLNKFLLFLGVISGVLAYETHFYPNYYNILSFFSILMIALSLIILRKGVPQRFKIGGFFIINTIPAIVAIISFTHIFSSEIQVSFEDIARLVSMALVSNTIYLFMSEDIFIQIIDLINSIAIPLALLNIFIFLRGNFLLWSTVQMRGASFFFDPNYFALMNDIAILYSVFYKKGIAAKLINLSILIPSVVLTFSRTGVLSLFIILFLYFILDFKNKKFYWLPFYFVFFLISSYLVFRLFESLPLYRLGMKLSGREELWRNLIVSIKENPLLAFLGEGFQKQSLHNFLLDYFRAYGIVYIIFIMILLLGALSLSYKNHRFSFYLILLFFIFSNFITISLGGIGLFSIIFSSLVILSLFPKLEK